ncbi:MAG: hypothetical protein PHQ18_03565 [Patescibacteria group bacterium]|nr:hypothetical protein [Patescibacteria group bacterium]
MNKKVSLAAAFGVLALVGAGCSSTTAPAGTGSDVAVESTKSEGLDGTWVITEATGQYAEMNKGTKYIFAGDKLTTKLGIIETKGTITSKTDSEMTVAFEGMSNPFVYKYSMEGGKLVLELTSSGGQVFTLVKQ